MVRQGIDADGVVGWGRGEQNAIGGDGALVLCLMAAVEAVLEKVQRYTETLEAEFVCQTELAKAEEVFVEVFGEVAADELFAAVVERTDAICACVVAKSRSLLCVS